MTRPVTAAPAARLRRRATALALASLTVAAIAAGAGPSAPAGAATVDDLPGLDPAELVTTDSTVVVGWQDDGQPVRHPDDLTDAAVTTAYEDFRLRVSQTEDLVNQTVQVAWSAGVPTGAGENNGVIQIMQCWSEGPDVPPTREQCAFGGTESSANDQVTDFRGRGVGIDPREDRYSPLATTNANGIAVNDAALSAPSANGPGTTWESDADLRVGWRFAVCPDETQSWASDLVLPRNPERELPDGTIDSLPARLPIVERTVGLPPAAGDNPATGRPEYTRGDGTLIVAETFLPPFSLDGLGQSPAIGGPPITGDQWPLGRYRVQVTCFGEGETTEGQPVVVGRGVWVLYRDSLFLVQGEPPDQVWRQPGTDGAQFPAPRALVPFDPLGEEAVDAATDETDPGAILEYVQPRTTNEVAFIRSRPNGTGTATVEMLIDLDAQHLGCGRVDAGGQPRSCWLVAVPRWGPEVPVDINGGLTDRFSRSYSPGPLSKTVWDRRVQVPLQFAPVASGCAITGDLRQILTNDSVESALRSWQPVFCEDPATAATVTPPLQDFQGRFSVGAEGNRMAVVTVPDQGIATQVAAPVAVSSLVIAFVIDRQFPGEADPLDGTRVTDLRLNQRLVAKLLTQSYDSGAAPNGGYGDSLYNGLGFYDCRPDTAGAQCIVPERDFPTGNPRNLFEDREFLDLNPDFETWTEGRGNEFYDVANNILVSTNDMDAYGVLWDWVLADTAARAFLTGEPDQNGMRINPYYRDQITESTSSFLLLDPTCGDRQKLPLFDDLDFPLLCGANFHPRTESDAVSVRSGVRGDTLRRTVVPSVFGGNLDDLAPRSDPRQEALSQLMLVMTTNHLAERFGVPTARLLNASGEYVRPTVATMTDARQEWSERDDGVLVAAPGEVGREGYPLTYPNYAVVDVAATTQSQNDAFADILEYVVSDGQVVGRGVGQLPPGYLPLDDALVADAEAAIALLRDPSSLLLNPTPSPSPTPSPTTQPATVPPTAPGPVTFPLQGGPSFPAGSALPPASPPNLLESPPSAGEPTAAATGDPTVDSADEAVQVEAVAAITPTATATTTLLWVVPLIAVVGVLAAVAGPLLTLLGRRRGSA
jgi:hypothetical protein